jgi:hypothetical protein
MPPTLSLAWFGSLVVAVSPGPVEVRQQLDATLAAHWREQRVAPAPGTDDATFLRRVYLDLTGRTPTARRVRDFLASPAGDKRARLVDELLASDAFAEHWGRVWAERLLGQRPFKQDRYDGLVLADYLRGAVKANRPYRAVVRELILAEGPSDASGPANFLLRYEARPADLTGAVARQFLGVSLQCAQCHDHPFQKWKKDEFWGMAAYFARVRLFEANAEDAEGLTGIAEARRGELMLPDSNAEPDEEGNVPKKAVRPQLPGATPDVSVPGKRRHTLADWITADANPYFASHAVNQTWSQFFGNGLMPALDGLDKQADARLLDAQRLLADDFRAGGYDLRRLIRAIVLSRAYQLSSGAAPAGDDDKVDLQVRTFARFPVRPLALDPLYRSIVQATGYHGDEQGEEQDEPAEQPERNPPGEDDPPPTDLPADLLGERALTVQRSLTLLNGDYIHQAVRAGVREIRSVLGARPTPAHVEALFLATLSRRPTPEEASAMLELAQTGEGALGLEDVLWALLNSAEFTSNH